MIGSEHFRLAEQHIKWAQSAGADNLEGEVAHLRYAAVHAQLANAAATIEVALAYRAGEQGGITRSLADWQDAMRPPQ